MSKSLAYYLEMSDPAQYPPGERAGTVRAINDIIQGRAQRDIEDLLAEAEQKGGSYYAGELAGLRVQIAAFQRQKELLAVPYTKSSSKAYKFKTWEDSSGEKLKVINQRLYDNAAKSGFPPEFFRKSLFDHVTVYCLPDGADLCFSVFQDCTFAVCRVKEARFDGARIYGTQFHSVEMEHATFFRSTIASANFHDSIFSHVSFQGASLRTCNIIDCKLDRVGFLDAVLDGCSFGRVTASGIRNLHTATITCGGVREDECRENRTAILRALCPADTPHARPTRGRGAR